MFNFDAKITWLISFWVLLFFLVFSEARPSDHCTAIAGKDYTGTIKGIDFELTFLPDSRMYCRGEAVASYRIENVDIEGMTGAIINEIVFNYVVDSNNPIVYFYGDNGQNDISLIISGNKVFVVTGDIYVFSTLIQPGDQTK